MFPHMYKVRPAKSQVVKQSDMATDCQVQRGENWRRNSGKWGSREWEGSNSPSPSTGGPSLISGPPPIPAPPQDPQDNLARKPSLTLKEPVKKTELEGLVTTRFRNRANSPRDQPVSNLRTRGNVINEPKTVSVEETPEESIYPVRRRVRNADPMTNSVVENDAVETPRSRVRQRPTENSSREEPVQQQVAPPIIRTRIRPQQVSSDENSQTETTPLRRRMRNDEQNSNQNTSINTKESENEISKFNRPSLTSAERSKKENDRKVIQENDINRNRIPAKANEVNSKGKFQTKKESEDEDEEEDDEDDDDEEDEIAKATRLWISGPKGDPKTKSSDSPALKKEIITYKISAPDKNTWDPDEDEVKRKDSIVSNDEWNDEMNDDKPAKKGFLGVLKRHVEPNAEKAAKLLTQQKEKPVSPAPVRLRKRTASPPLAKKKSEGKASSSNKELIPPPPPPPPPPKNAKGIPPPPPPPLSETKVLTARDLELKVLREKMVENIKKASRSRPDWHSVMKDIEGGIKLRKVSSDKKMDRSMPILPDTRTNGGKFIYESEKPIVQNEMLNEIQRGVRLRHVRTNDRSKPDFHKLGLRKFRRQLTTQEKEKINPDAPEALPSSSDEEEDIDRMRDDLAATKTQLTDEIKKTQRMEREHKILKIDIESLQAEVKRLKRRLKEAGVHDIKPLANGEADALGPKLSKSMSKLRMREDDLDFSELDVIEEDIKLLNDQIEAQRLRAERAEVKFEELNQKLLLASNSSDEWELRSIYFEKKYKGLQKEQGIELPDINCFGTQTEPVEIITVQGEGLGGLPAKKSSSRKSFGSVYSRMQSFQEEDESDDETSSSEDEDTLSEGEEDGEGNNVESPSIKKGSDLKKEKELKMWESKYTNMKEKEKNIIKERNNLRERIKKYYKDMRMERKEFLKAKAELQELADQMKEMDEEEEEEEEDSVSEDESDEDTLCCNDSVRKPKKLKKKRKTNEKTNECDKKDEEEEREADEENLEDLSSLEGPHWSESEEEEEEEEESEYEDEDEDVSSRLKYMKEKTENYEQKMNALKKENYLLKNQIDACEELYAEERRRHARLDNELHMLLAAM